MRQLYCIRKPNGKLAGQCYSRASAEREIAWLIAAGWPGPFTIETGLSNERTYQTQWGSVPGEQRAGFRWSPGKIAEFIKRYARGDAVNDLAGYFDTSITIVTKKAREFGFNKRIDDPRNFEKHRGRWTDREEELVNFMYDEIGKVGAIADAHPRGEGAIKSRLRDTAPELSTRSRTGRFIGGPRGRSIRPALEDT